MHLPAMDLQKKTRFTGIQKSAAAYLLAELLPQTKSPLLLVCAEEEQASALQEDLQFFLSFQGANASQVLQLPAWENSPYRKFSPSISQRLLRLRTLYQALHAKQSTLIVASVAALLQVASGKDFLRRSLALTPKAITDPEELEKKLLAMGYTKMEAAEDVGTFSRRGGILDLFSPFHSHPARIEFFDTEIESIRFYNAETQRSLDALKENEFLHVIPAREMDCSPENLLASRERIRAWSDERDLPRSAREQTVELLAQGIVTGEMDYFLSFFREETAFSHSYFKNFTWVWCDQDQIKAAAEKFLEKEEELSHKALAEEQLAPALPQTFSSISALFAEAENGDEIFLDPLLLENKVADKTYALHAGASSFQHASEKNKKKKSANVDHLAEEIEKHLQLGEKILVVANSQSQIDRISFLLSQRKIKSRTIKSSSDLVPSTDTAYLVLGSVSSGFVFPESKLFLLSEDEIFGRKTHTKSNKPKGSSLKYLDELQLDDLVVHAEHGIGRYKGLLKIKAGDSAGDFVHLEYAENDKLYLPVYRLDLLQKYVGSPGTRASLDRLGSQHFQKAKDKVKAAVKDIAGKLLRVHAERALKKGFAFSEPDEVMREFEAEFPYDETPDQLKAIEDTINDMCSPQPMDRLVCGDVGFGKTEVAIRAAFKAAQDGKQVAVLVPTTILAEQHYQTFSSRLSEHPMRVASISRFKTKAEQKQVLLDLAAGKVDIIIGTHRLLSKDVSFRDLGLLVIDEEQRFGVEHKEKLKEIRASTDVLTLTATPIPRTLHLALMGLRDISTIQTAPMDRLSIKTHLATFDPELIKSVIETELARGGQVFFIHNRVQTIHEIQKMLVEYLPKLRVGVAHGQMNETELERVMLGFYQKKFDVLLATTIIENGLDVSNANTIIVNRADTFGLSQLYQIRGRVGRSQARAYAYFLIPETAAISDDARERLAILQRLVELGSGYAIAAHDLELRGGGDILGGAQSGHISDVGYDMYLELLEEEIQRLKGETVAAPKEEVEINSPFPALLPEEYIPDMRARLGIYRRLSNLDTEEKIFDAEAELVDRYGKIPEETESLLWLLQLKLLMQRMGFKTLTIGRQAFSILAGKNPQISLEKLLQLVSADPKKLSISPEGKLTLRTELRSLKQVYDEARKIIEAIHNA